MLKAGTMRAICFVVSQGASDSPVHPAAPVSSRRGSVSWLVPAGCPLLAPLSLLLSKNWFSMVHHMLVMWDLVTPKVDAWQGWYLPRRIIPEEAGSSYPSVATLPSLMSLEHLCAILFSPTVLCLHSLAVRRDEVQSPRMCLCLTCAVACLASPGLVQVYSVWVLLSWSDPTGHLHPEQRQLNPSGDGLTPWQSLEGFFCSELCDDFTKTTKGGL